MIDMLSNYDNMHKNGMFYDLIFLNNHIFASYDCMLSYSCIIPIFDVFSLVTLDARDL